MTDVNKAIKLHEESALLGNYIAEYNYHIIIDTMSDGRQYKGHYKLLNYIKYFEESSPNRLTNVVLMRIALNNPRMFKEIFEDNVIIKAKYKSSIEGHPNVDFLQLMISKL